MTTKYIVKEERCVNDWGRTERFDYCNYVDTFEEAKAIGEEIETCGWVPNWVIVKTTMDEKTFTVTNEEVYNYEEERG